jgi:hypothetical protein
MTNTNDADTRATLAKLAVTRAEILRILEPPPEGDGAEAPSGQAAQAFPRSRTMRLLLSGRGIGTASAVLGGLIIARPAIAWRLLRMLPATAVARVLLVKAIASFRTRSKTRAAAAPGDRINPA